jgi:hypothetical protein
MPVPIRRGVEILVSRLLWWYFSNFNSPRLGSISQKKVVNSSWLNAYMTFHHSSWASPHSAMLTHLISLPASPAEANKAIIFGNSTGGAKSSLRNFDDSRI